MGTTSTTTEWKEPDIARGDTEALVHYLLYLRDRPPMCDLETTHVLADRALVQYIGDPNVTHLHDAVAQWCA